MHGYDEQYGERVRVLEGKGMTTSDAQGVADAELMKGLDGEWPDGPDLPMDREPAALLREFVEFWRGPMKCDEPIDGADAVEWLAEFWPRAAQSLKEE